MFDRIEKLIGRDKIIKIINSRVCLVGVGGVGGTCLETLVRSGFMHITIIDYDIFEESNLNRQIYANVNVLDKKKVQVAKAKCKLINPDIDIVAKDLFLDENNLSFLKKYDYIIDACDSTPTKIALYKYACENNIKIISSMGMGNRFNPEKVKIMKLSETKYDPLAKKIKNTLKKDKINYDPYVVSSIEIPKKISNGPISSMMMVPSVAGILMAYYVINDLTKK